MTLNSLQNYRWKDCVLRRVSYDLDTRTLVIDVHLPALLTGECRRAVITNCDWDFSGQLTSHDVASRRLITEPVIPTDFAIVNDEGLQLREGTGTVIFSTATGSVSVTGGIASVDDYLLDMSDLPLDLSKADLSEAWTKAA